ncbi:MAG: D-amino-acid dehydrogenase [Gammaproteobacteria bacterium]|jgi:D-amino-acid dehydrogenase
MAKHTVIIGAGIVGVCCARYLQMEGERVTLLDRTPIGDGCSFGNAGVLCSWACEPAAKPGLWKKLPGWILDPLGPVSLKPGYLPQLLPWLWQFFSQTSAERMAHIAEAMFTLNHPTVDLYRQLLAGTGHEALVVDSSYVYVTRKPSSLNPDAASWRMLRERGAPVTVLDADALRDLEPDLSSAYLKGVALGAQGRVTNPGRLVTVLGEMVIADGGQFRQCVVHGTRPRPAGGAIVTTDAGDIEAPRLIIAAGAWSHHLAKPFGVDIPLQGERGYHMEFRNPAVTINNSVHDWDRSFVASSMEGGVRCAGTSEFNALEAPPDWRRARLMKRLGKDLFPNLNIDEGSEWMGHRPTLPDTIPVIGALVDHPDVILAFGHSHLGLTGAPMTGRIVAAIATAEPMNADSKPYAPLRFN